MKAYEKLYRFKDNPKFIEKNIGDFLLYQIYSPCVIRTCYPLWPQLPKVYRENTPPEIESLMEMSPFLNTDQLAQKLNRYQIEKAIKVLKSYQNCSVPLTQDQSVKKTRRKLTSSVGDSNLKILQQALQKGNYSNAMADLAVRCSHKFLFDKRNYRHWHISSEMAKKLAKERIWSVWLFPAIQLTKGCENRCSHCCDRAESNLSHMPWPVFVDIYKGLNRHYRFYPQESCGHYFSQFFADSDMLSYQDPIMGADSGDAAMWVAQEKGYFNVMTRGVTNQKSELALRKVIMSEQPLVISFVDSPNENMHHNIDQLRDTLDVVESMKNRKFNPSIVHLHTKNGPTVPDSIFRGFPDEKRIIWAFGRGKDLPADETERFPDSSFSSPNLIEPNGNIILTKIKDGENVKMKLTSLYGVNHCGKRFSTLMKFVRRLKKKIRS